MLRVLGSLYNWANKHGRAISLVASVSWALAGGAITAWGAHAASIFAQYTPFSWVCAGMLGALAATGSLALIGIFRAKLAQAQVMEFARKPPTTVNPLRSNFEREKINLSDFWSFFVETRTYKGVVFRQCDIFGPGSIILHNGTTFAFNHVGTCDLICVRNVTINTAIVFTDTLFRECRFVNVSIFMTPDVAAAMIKDATSQGGSEPMIIGYREIMAADH
jgi:hypothetical protein